GFPLTVLMEHQSISLSILTVATFSTVSFPPLGFGSCNPSPVLDWSNRCALVTHWVPDPAAVRWAVVIAIGQFEAETGGSTDRCPDSCPPPPPAKSTVLPGHQTSGRQLSVETAI